MSYQLMTQELLDLHCWDVWTPVVTERPVLPVVELGSGETTALIDRLRPAESGMHVAYGHADFLVERVRTRAPRYDVHHAPIVAHSFGNVAFGVYGGMKSVDFDCFFADGPNRTDHLPRFDCATLVAASLSKEFIVIFDDAGRPREHETVLVLKRRSVCHKPSGLAGRITQAVVTSSGFSAALCHH